jgi:hypothetical protein
MCCAGAGRYASSNKAVFGVQPQHPLLANRYGERPGMKLIWINKLSERPGCECYMKINCHIGNCRVSKSILDLTGVCLHAELFCIGLKPLSSESLKKWVNFVHPNQQVKLAQICEVLGQSTVPNLQEGAEDNRLHVYLGRNSQHPAESPGYFMRVALGEYMRMQNLVLNSSGCLKKISREQLNCHPRRQGG